MQYQITELKIILNDNNKKVKNVILVMDDNHIMNVDPMDMKIEKVTIPGEIFTINVSNANIKRKEQLIRYMECYSDSISKCRKLAIMIGGNNIKNSLFEDIVDYLELYKDRLYSLDISSNFIQKQGLKKLLSFLSVCPKFKHLNCNKNFFNETIFEETVKEFNLPNHIKENLRYKAF